MNAFLDFFTPIGASFTDAFRIFGKNFMGTIPGILSAIIVLVIAWLFASLISSGFERILRTVKFDTMAERFKITDFLRQSGILSSPSAIIGRCIYWVFVLLFIASVAEALDWKVVSYEITKLLGYIPNFISAITFFVIGIYLASFVRDLVRGATSSLGISTGRIISSSIYYLLFIIVVLTALQQGGIDTGIISSNLLIIMGAIMASASLSYGFASREVLSNILAGFFNRRNFNKGMVIEIDGVRGMIVEMNNISITIQINETEKMVIPAHDLMTSRVKIIKAT
jgi:small-conductance mechanosensitive channel